MAVRREALDYPTSSGRVLRFPAERAAARLRRQRLVEGRRRLALLVAGLVVIAGVVLGGGTGTTAVASRPGAPQKVVLQPGETLWSVATEYAPAGVDPRAYVDALEQLNDLKGAVRAGMQLTLPR
ncbi:MAG: LysM peptidoglycan-binding domain-containing protein [Actinomycetota bacterium]